MYCVDDTVTFSCVWIGKVGSHMTKNFAHRGFSGRYPENTMLAFEKALEVGVHGIELDVQLTQDGEPVIMHDESVDRTTDGTGLVISHTYAELRKLEASYTYRGCMGINRIPSLKEYMEMVKDKKIVTNIELKTGILEYPGIEQKVLDLIHEYHLEDRVIISSFNHYSVLRMRELAPELKYGLLSETWLVQAGRYVHDLGISCYHPMYRNLTEEVVQEIKQYGIEINTYTVNSREAILDMKEKGIDVVIGNYPDLIKDILI